MLVIGIAGGSGSGKTTLANIIKNKYPDKTEIVNFDDYYKPNDELILDERKKINYDSPEAFDSDLFFNDLFKLKSSSPPSIPKSPKNNNVFFIKI